MMTLHGIAIRDDGRSGQACNETGKYGNGPPMQSFHIMWGHVPKSITVWKGSWKFLKCKDIAFPSSKSIEYLRSHKVGRVARCHEQPILSTQLFGKTKVGDSKALWLAGRISVEEVGWL